MALLITGAAGYVGSHILPLLSSDYKEDILTPSIDELDLADYQALRRFFQQHQINHVIHLAAIIDNSAKKDLLLCNLTALYNLAYLSVEYKVKHFIMASTNNVYGIRDNTTPIKESDQRKPLFGNDYGLTKYCGELLAEDIFKETNTKLTILRIGDIYGPYQKASALMKGVVSNLKAKTPQKIYGRGERVRDYIYIDDVAKGFVHILNNEISGIYNLGTGIGSSVLDIVNIASSISECKQQPQQVIVEKEDTSKVTLDVASLKSTGFAATITLKEGLERIIKEED